MPHTAHGPTTCLHASADGEVCGEIWDPEHFHALKCKRGRCPYATHNSIADCLSLRQLVHKISSENDLLVFSGSLPTVIDQIKHKQMIKQARSSFDPVISKDGITAYMATKMSKTGLFIEHITAAYSRGGFDGLAAVLKEKGQDGKARVTDDANSINKIVKGLNDANLSVPSLSGVPTSSALKSNEMLPAQ